MAFSVPNDDPELYRNLDPAIYGQYVVDRYNMGLDILACRVNDFERRCNPTYGSIWRADSIDLFTTTPHLTLANAEALAYGNPPANSKGFNTSTRVQSGVFETNARTTKDNV
jgi:hypothetical protein